MPYELVCAYRILIFKNSLVEIVFIDGSRACYVLVYTCIVSRARERDSTDAQHRSCRTAQRAARGGVRKVSKLSHFSYFSDFSQFSHSLQNCHTFHTFQTFQTFYTCYNLHLLHACAAASLPRARVHACGVQASRGVRRASLQRRGDSWQATIHTCAGCAVDNCRGMAAETSLGFAAAGVTGALSAIFSPPGP
jgi:hypothetical protein